MRFNQTIQFLIASLFLVTAAGCVSTGKYKKLVGESETLEDTLTNAQDEIDLLNSNITELGVKIVDLEKKNAVLGESNENLSAALNEKKGELSKRVSDLNADKLELEERVAALEKARDDLAKAQQEKLAKVKNDYDNLVSGLEKDLQAGQIKITQLEGKLTVNIADKIFFNSGQAKLNKNGKEVLGRLGEVIKSLDNKQVVVEGHTDNAPIGKSLKNKFPSNWELSTARATEVVRFLEEEGSIDPSRLIAVGYGSSRPLAENSSAEGRSKNRRIEIVFQDQNWKKIEPLK